MVHGGEWLVAGTLVEDCNGAICEGHTVLTPSALHARRRDGPDFGGKIEFGSVSTEQFTRAHGGQNAKLQGARGQVVALA
jgi:hypothetical protein